MDRIKKLIVLFGFLIWSLSCFVVFHSALVITVAKRILFIFMR